MVGMIISILFFNPVGKLPVTTIIPEIEIANQKGVIEDALNEVRQGRLFYRAINTPVEKLYTHDELLQLEEIYESKLNAVDRSCDIRALKNMLNSIHINITETELQNLVASFSLYTEMGSVTALGFASVTGEADAVNALAAEAQRTGSDSVKADFLTTLSFHQFARIVAVVVDQESRKSARSALS